MMNIWTLFLSQKTGNYIVENANDPGNSQAFGEFTEALDYLMSHAKKHDYISIGAFR